MTHPTATEHSCSLDHSVRCPVHQTGKPRTKACPVCGAVWAVHIGTYAVVTWRRDGRYSVEDAVATYARPAAAQRRAEAEGEKYVVRFIPV